MKSRVTRIGVVFAFALGLLGFDLVSASAAQVNVSVACDAFDEARINAYDSDSLARLASAAEVAVVPASVVDAIASGDQATIAEFFTTACVDPEDTTGSACLLFGGLRTDDGDARALAAAQLRFVLDNAASQIIADSLDQLTDPTQPSEEAMNRLDGVFTAACSNVDLPALAPTPPPAEPTTAPDTAPTAIPDAEPTATPDPTATPVPDPTATPVPDPTATPEPDSTATPEPTVASSSSSGSSGSGSSGDSTMANLPQTGPGDFTTGLAQMATIILSAGLLFLALEGHAHLRSRRLALAATAAMAPPEPPPLTPSAELGREPELGTLADVRYRNRPRS